MSDIFVSYCRRNKEFIQKLTDRLVAEGRDIWVDWQDIPPNADWRAEIAEGIEKAHTVIFALSPDWLASYECNIELELAVKHNKRLLPIVCEDVQYKEVKPSLASLNWIFFRPADNFEDAYKALQTALDTDLQYVKSHTRLLTRAIEWDKKDRDGSFLLRGTDFIEAQQWLKEAGNKSPQPTPLHTDYVISSGQNQSKQQKMTILGVGAGLVVACGLAIAAFSQYKLAEEKKREVEQTQVMTLSETASATFANNNQLDALLAAIKANVQLNNMPWVSASSDTYQDAESTLRLLLELIVEDNRMEGHTDLIHNIRVSPDGQIIASTSADNTTRLWNADGSLLTTLEGHTSTVWSVMFSPDGQIVATTSEDGTVRFWKLDGTPLGLLEFDSPVWSVSFSPVDDVIAVATADGTVRIMRPDGTMLNQWQRDQGKVFSIRFSPDGQTVITGSSDKIARIWNLEGELLQTFEGHSGEIWAVRFSPDGQRVATASADNTMKLWDLQGNLLQTFEGHRSGIISIAFSPNGERLASASADHTVRLWTIKGEMINTFHHNDIVAGVDFLSNDRLASGSYDKTVRVWRIYPELQQSLREHQRRILSISLSGDSRFLASSSTDRTVQLWQRDDQGNFSMVRSLQMPAGEPNSVSLDQSAELIVVGSTDGNVYVWNQQGELLYTLAGHQAEVFSVSVSPNGEFIASASADKTIKIWSRDGELLRMLERHTEGVRSVAFSPDSERLASGGSDNKIFIWSIDGELLHELDDHEAMVFSVAFSPDGQWLASGSMDDTVKLWNANGKLQGSFEAHISGVTSVSFSADSKTIASGSFDNSVILWTLNGQIRRIFNAHQQRVSGVGFSNDGQILASAAADKMVKIWDMTQLQPVPEERDQLIEESCEWLQPYLLTNENVSESDRTLCDSVLED